MYMQTAPDYQSIIRGRLGPVMDGLLITLDIFMAGSVNDFCVHRLGTFSTVRPNFYDFFVRKKEEI